MSPTAINITTTLRQRLGLTDQTASADVDQACRRLGLRSIRAVIEGATEAAVTEHLSCLG